MATTNTTTRKAATTKAKAANTTAPAPEAVTEAPAYGLRAAPTKQGTRRTMLAEDTPLAIAYMQDGKAANPKRPGTGAHVRFAQYMALEAAKGANGYTVANVLDRGVQPSDLLYNLRHGYVVAKGYKVDGRNVVADTK